MAHGTELIDKGKRVLRRVLMAFLDLPEVPDVVGVDVDVGQGVVTDVQLIDLTPERPILLKQSAHLERALQRVPQNVRGGHIPGAAGAVDAHRQDAEVVPGVPATPEAVDGSAVKQVAERYSFPW